jgi:hypothetical protein
MSTRNVHGGGVGGRSWLAERYIDDIKARYVPFNLLYSHTDIFKKHFETALVCGHGPIMFHSYPSAFLARSPLSSFDAFLFRLALLTVELRSSLPV